MRRLWVQLTLAFTLVTLVSVTVAALLANQQTSAQFQGFLAQSQVQESGLPDALAASYQKLGGWGGAEDLLASWHGPGGAGRGMMRGAPALTLADPRGAVVAGRSDSGGALISASERASALPIIVDGATVGLLVARPAGAAGLTTAAARFLAQVNQALLQAGLLGAALGALLGLLVARGLSAPLDRLARAAGQVARGDLAQRVPIGGPTEVAAAGQAFNEMAAALESAEGLRQRMVADIAHELRTPLAVIQGNLQAILDGVYPLERAEIQTIYDETLLLARLVGDLRDLALAEAGQLQLQLAPTDAASIIDQGAAAFHALAAERGVVVQTTHAGDLPLVLADRERVGQVIRNLVANAIRHTTAGGSVRLRAEPSAASPGGRPAPCVLITVEDTGAGIAPEDIPHVFERFWRADRSRARAQGGSGLGLAIARQIIHAHGGEIGVRSTRGRGSSFWLTLPCAQGPASALGAGRPIGG